MGTEIKKFDPKDYVQAIRERIRGAIVDVIPPEAWDEMVLAEMKAFTQDTLADGSYGSPRTTQPSPLRRAIQDLLAEDAKMRVKAMLSSPEWSAHWDSANGGRSLVGTKIEEIIKANAAEILNAWLGQSFQSIISQLPYHAR